MSYVFLDRVSKSMFILFCYANIVYSICFGPEALPCISSYMKPLWIINNFNFLLPRVFSDCLNFSVSILDVIFLVDTGIFIIFHMPSHCLLARMFLRKCQLPILLWFLCVYKPFSLFSCIFNCFLSTIFIMLCLVCLYTQPIISRKEADHEGKETDISSWIVCGKKPLK